MLDVQKAYDTVLRDGLWLKLWDMGVKGRMWCVIKKMYEASRNTVLLEGEKSAMFSVEQGVAQGCSLHSCPGLPCQFLGILNVPYFMEFYDSPINPVQSHCRVPDIPIPESWECWRRPRHVPSVPLQSA